MPDGIATAKAAGLHFKINAVALKDVNEERFDDLIRWTHGGGMNLTLIVTMPLGEIGADRTGPVPAASRWISNTTAL